MKKIILLSFLILIAGVFLWPGHNARAQLNSDMAKQLQAAGVESGTAGAGGAPTDPRVVVMRIIRVALSLIGTIFLCLTIYAGFLWMTAGGNEENIEKAKKTITRSVIGLVIVLTSYSITILVAKVAFGQYTAYDNGIWTKPLPPPQCGMAGFSDCP